MEKTINTKQFAVLIFIIAVSSRIFMLPALILGISGRDSWLTILAYYLVDLLVLLFILGANRRNPSANVHEFLQASMGKIAARVVFTLVIAFYLFKATVLISEVKVFFTITATQNLSWQLCVIPLLTAFGLMSLKSLRSIGRVGEVFLPLFLLTLVILGLIMAKSTDFTNMLPVFQNGIKDNFHSFLMLPIWLMDFSVLTIFLGKIEHRKSIKKISILACSLSLIVVIYFNVIMFSSYSNIPKLLGYGHNITNMVLYSTGTYNYGRFDLIIFSIWMVGVLIHVLLLFYASCRHLSFVSNIKNNSITALICVIVLFVLIVHVFPDEQILYSYTVFALNYAAFAIEFFFPLLIFISSLLFRKRTLNNKAKLIKNTQRQ